MTEAPAATPAAVPAPAEPEKRTGPVRSGLFN